MHEKMQDLNFPDTEYTWRPFTLEEVHGAIAKPSH
jgi:hypothetical protein